MARHRKKTLSWDALLDYFQTTPDGAVIFQKIQQRGKNLSGIVVAAWEKKTPFPTHYLTSGLAFARFEDLSSQDPKMYQTLRGITAAVNRWREDDYVTLKGLNVGLWHWVHPEAHFKPIAEFVKLRNQFPGSP